MTTRGQPETNLYTPLIFHARRTWYMVLMFALTRIIEFSTGIGHFKYFLDYQKNNVISQLLASCRLSVYNKSAIKYELHIIR